MTEKIPTLCVKTKGTDLSSTVTMEISGAGVNMTTSSRKANWDMFANDMKCFGYGDGLNQLESRSFHATTVRTELTSDINETDTTIPLLDASAFPIAGSVWVGCERVIYNEKSGNDLIGCIRGVAFMGNADKAYAHSKYSPIYDAQYTDGTTASYPWSNFTPMYYADSDTLILYYFNEGLMKD
jgi:hypothetical protein